MLNRVQLKQLAKDQLRDKWTSGALLTFVYLVVLIPAGLISLIPIIGYVLTILITAPLLIGMLIAYLNFIKKTGQLDINDLFKGFEMYGKSLAVCLLYSVLVFLWFLLLVVPGIIKAISYSQAVYIVAENPNVEAIEAIRISTKMTNGYKLDIFIMFFSFIGWALLCALTLGVGYIWLAPYMNTTFTNMYLKLKEISIRNGVCSESEFAGHIS